MTTWGIKVSKPGYDVKTCAVTDLVFSSELNTLKVKYKAAMNSGDDYTHSLSYVPIVFFVKKYSSTKASIIGQEYGCSVNSTVVHAYSNLYVYVFYESGV